MAFQAGDQFLGLRLDHFVYVNQFGIGVVDYRFHRLQMKQNRASADKRFIVCCVFRYQRHDCIEKLSLAAYPF